MPGVFAYFINADRFNWLDIPLCYLAFHSTWLFFCWFFPAMIKPMWWVFLHGIYRLRFYGQENIPREGPALVICNHSSYIDWMLLWLASPRRMKFMLWAGYYKNPILRFWLSFVRHHSVKLENRTGRAKAISDALDQAAEELSQGNVVVIFPEGRLTRNGYMLPFGRGIERILKLAKCPVPVIPAGIDNMWGSFFSHKGGKICRKWPEKWWRRVSVGFGPALPPQVTAPEARLAVQTTLTEIAIKQSDNLLPVHRGFVRFASSWRFLFKPFMVDNATGQERILTGGQSLVAVWCLARWLKKRIPEPAKPIPDLGRGAIGIWLPTGMGSTLANVACAFLRRPTVNLNYTAGTEACTSAALQSQITHIITSKRFEAKVPCPLPDSYVRISLEDALAAIPKWEKLLKLIAAIVLPHWFISRFFLGLHKTQLDDVLTIIFSSGSTGDPKGVMLTYRNITSNDDSFVRGVMLDYRDVMMATLPFFHSFGYTVCLWAPIAFGIKVVYYPDPRAAKEVGELTRKHRCTIILGTATFLRFYLRRCEPEDFKSCRLIICGAEKLPVKLAHEFHDKFGVMPLEGYGCTELSPVVSTNLPDNTIAKLKQKANVFGTVGQPIPGICARAQDPQTHKPLPPGEEGMIACRGPNVMKGYLHQPEKTRDVIINGWYLTGDMGLIEPDGFIRITGRLSRFAKIAGEMVPLEKIEEEMHEELGTGERLLVLCAVPDEKRGERIVVLYLAEATEKLDAALAVLPSKGIPNLWIPSRKDCHIVNAFPSLGSGKLDFRAVSEYAKTLYMKS